MSRLVGVACVSGCPGTLPPSVREGSIDVVADDKPGFLWDVIQEWIDSHRYPPTQRQLAKRIGVSHSIITEWKYGRSFPGPEALERLATELRVPYERVLDAALHDAGYRHAEPPEDPARHTSKRRRSG